MLPNESEGYNSKADVWSFGISLVNIFLLFLFFPDSKKK